MNIRISKEQLKEQLKENNQEQMNIFEEKKGQEEI